MNIGILILIITIVVFFTIVMLVKFFQLCKDVRTIREHVEGKWEILSAVELRPKGTNTPTEADIKQFQHRVCEHIKANECIDWEWIERLIASYNEKFNEDFHQYLKRQ